MTLLLEGIEDLELRRLQSPECYQWNGAGIGRNGIRVEAVAVLWHFRVNTCEKDFD